jgi:hypothetical protein
MNPRRLFTVVLLVTGLMLTSACTAGSNGPDNRGAAAGTGQEGLSGVTEEEAGAMEYEEMLAELAQTQARLTLPPGAQWPPPPPEPEPEPDAQGVLHGMSYAPGVGRSIAEFMYYCVWAAEYLSQRGVDPEREAAALAALQKFEELDAYRVDLDDAGRQAFDQDLQRALLGDPTGIAQYVQVGCTG